MTFNLKSGAVTSNVSDAFTSEQYFQRNFNSFLIKVAYVRPTLARPRINENPMEISRTSLIEEARPALRQPRINENPVKISRTSLIEEARLALRRPQINENPAKISRTSLIKEARPAFARPRINENPVEISRTSLIEEARPAFEQPAVGEKPKKKAKIRQPETSAHNFQQLANPVPIPGRQRKNCKKNTRHQRVGRQTLCSSDVSQPSALGPPVRVSDAV
ncbi:MAG: hypothetical protein Q4C18_00410 [Eubacteriales bacterium]|nr:hypothetical protein [Eubacteriales bacterium]